MSNGAQVKCGRCGSVIPHGEGFVFNQDLSRLVKGNPGVLDLLSGTSRVWPGCGDGEARKQVIVCPGHCPSYLADAEEDLDVAGKAARTWWGRHVLGEEVYITREMACDQDDTEPASGTTGSPGKLPANLRCSACGRRPKASPNASSRVSQRVFSSHCMYCGEALVEDPEGPGGSSQSSAGAPQKLRCLACGYVMLVTDPDNAPSRCQRCDDRMIQYIDDDVQIITIGGSGGSTQATVTTGADLPASTDGAPLLQCFECGKQQDLPAGEPTDHRGLTCSFCDSTLTAVIPFDQAPQCRQAKEIGREGERLYGEEQYEEAASMFGEALALSPQDPVLLLDLGNALGMVGWRDRSKTKLRESLGHLREACDLYPTYERAQRNLQITEAKLAELLDAQNLVCAVCGKSAELARLSGNLICRDCNHAIEAQTAGSLFGGEIPAAIQAAWDTTWAESVVAGTEPAEPEDEAADHDEIRERPSAPTLSSHAVGWTIALIAVALVVFVLNRRTSEPDKAARPEDGAARHVPPAPVAVDIEAIREKLLGEWVLDPGSIKEAYTRLGEVTDVNAELYTALRRSKPSLRIDRTTITWTDVLTVGEGGDSSESSDTSVYRLEQVHSTSPDVQIARLGSIDKEGKPFAIRELDANRLWLLRGRRRREPYCWTFVRKGTAPKRPSPSEKRNYAGRYRKHTIGEDRPARLTNSIGMAFAYVLPGDFLMGSPIEEEGTDRGATVHPVRITHGYYLAITETTQAQWEAVSGRPSPMRYGGGKHPVRGINWHDAVIYCKRLSKREGKTYRLPTEAEWEYACRAGSRGAFSGEHDTFAWDVGLLLDQGWCRVNSKGSPQPVATRQANAWGFHDMHGNLAEWCHDTGESYYSQALREVLLKRQSKELSPAVHLDAAVRAFLAGTSLVDPVGVTEDKRWPGRVHRGGAWLRSPVECRSACRSTAYSTDRRGSRGLRVLLEDPSPYIIPANGPVR